MKATIGLEFIGANTSDLLSRFERIERAFGIGADEDLPRRGPFIAEVGRAPDGSISLRYLSGKRDYSRANSKGSRGIYVWYILEDNRLYLVHEKTSWRGSRDYFCTVNLDGSIYPLSESEAHEWLSVL